MITVIAGKYKGRKLSFIKNVSVRPTQAKVKKSIFDILGNLDGKIVLDLYCGVGGFGIEALSRGAKELSLVEKNPKVFKILLKNISQICVDDQIKLHRIDVEKFLNMNKKKFNLIFVDPPYGEFDFLRIKEIASKFLFKDGILCMEMKKNRIFDNIENVRIKHYGSTQVIFWQKIT